MPVYFLIYIDYNEPFFDSDNGGFGDIFRKKSLNVSVKLWHQINDITSITAKW